MTETIDEKFDETFDDELLDSIKPFPKLSKTIKGIGIAAGGLAAVAGLAYPLVSGAVKGWSLEAPVPEYFGATEYGAVAAAGAVPLGIAMAVAGEESFLKPEWRDYSYVMPFAGIGLGVGVVGSPVLHVVGYTMGFVGKMMCGALGAIATSP